MESWRYTVVSYINEEQVEQVLNEYGEKGWELVSALYDPKWRGIVKAIFKKRG